MKGWAQLFAGGYWHAVQADGRTLCAVHRYEGDTRAEIGPDAQRCRVCDWISAYDASAPTVPATPPPRHLPPEPETTHG